MSHREMLLIACKNNDIASVKSLIASNYDFRIYNQYYESFMLAYINGHDYIARMLLHHKNFNINAKNKNNNKYITLLYYACNRGDEKLVDLLLTKKNIDIYIDFPIIVAYEKGYNNIVTKLIYHKNFNINYRNSRGYSLLRYACESNSIELVKLLFAYNKTNIPNKTFINNIILCHAFNFICESGYEEIFDLFIEHTNIDVNHKYGWDGSSLDIACSNNNHQIIKKLLILGAKGVITHSFNEINNNDENDNAQRLINNDNAILADIIEIRNEKFWNKFDQKTHKLINEYKKNNNIVKQWDNEIKMKDIESMITPIILVSDGYYQIKQINQTNNDNPNVVQSFQGNPPNVVQSFQGNTVRFVTITKDLPQELQILIVSLMFNNKIRYALDGNLITQYCRDFFYRTCK
jgi:ankyrin repeat protein